MGGWRKRTCAGKGLASNTGFVPGPAAGRASALDSGRRASALPGKFGIRTFWHNLALRLPVRAWQFEHQMAARDHREDVSVDQKGIGPEAAPARPQCHAASSCQSFDQVPVAGLDSDLVRSRFGVGAAHVEEPIEVAGLASRSASRSKLVSQPMPVFEHTSREPKPECRSVMRVPASLASTRYATVVAAAWAPAGYHV